MFRWTCQSVNQTNASTDNVYMNIFIALTQQRNSEKDSLIQREMDAKRKSVTIQQLHVFQVDRQATNGCQVADINMETAQWPAIHHPQQQQQENRTGNAQKHLNMHFNALFHITQRERKRERYEMPHIQLDLLQKCVCIFSMRLSSGQRQQQNLVIVADLLTRTLFPHTPNSLWSSSDWLC